MKKNNIYHLNKNSIIGIYLPILLIAISIFFLFWNLDGDPSILKRYGDYGDEGYWVQNSINKILHGTFLTDDQSQSFFGAPLYNQILTLQFNIFGVSFFSARLISIIFLFLTVIVLYFILISQIKNKNYILLYIAAFLLLFDNKLYYQWATPVPVEVFFQSLVILFLIKYKLDNYKTTILVILLMYLSILSKTTSIWLIGFVLIIFLLDNFNMNNISITKKLILKLLFFSIICITPFLLLNYYFATIEPDKFASFTQLLKQNVGLNKTIFYNFLNPIYYLQQLTQILKFPNSFFLLIMPLTIVIFIGFSRLKNKMFLFSENRVYLVLFTYVLVFIIFLLLIGQFGYDRRQINLIFPLYVISVLLYDKFLNKEIKFKYILFLCVLFIVISILQFKHLWQCISMSRSLGLSSQSKLIVVLIVLFYFLISCYFIFRYKLKFLFVNFIFLNIIFHFIFINNDHSLIDANKKIKEVTEKYNAKFITGYAAHHLAVESNVIPIWWLDKSLGYPSWNINFPLFSKANPTLIITDLQLNKSCGYFPLKNIPHGFSIIESDTLFCFRNKFTNCYTDTLIMHVVQ